MRHPMRQPVRVWIPRLLGLALLVFFLARVGLEETNRVIRKADVVPLLLAVSGNALLILVKTRRWQVILGSQSVPSRTWPAFLAYFSSLFVGLLTPGRLGEFVRAAYVVHEAGAPPGLALSGVLADRLFDLYALLLVGGLAVFTVTGAAAGPALLMTTGLLTLPLGLLLRDAAFGRLQGLGLRLGRLGQRFFAEQGPLAAMRLGLRCLSLRHLLLSAGLTVLAYVIYFGQAYLLAWALDLGLGPLTVSAAVALGSLVALVPVSIAGLGTREAAIITYLGSVGVPAESALAFSLLVFLTFHVGGALLGAVAWWLRPVPFGGPMTRG